MHNLHTDKLELKNILKEVWNSKYDFHAKIPDRPNYIFEIYDNSNEYGIAVPGSIVEVSGLSKTRKSTLISLFAAAAISPKKYALNVRSSMEGVVVWIDTEQNDTEFKFFQKRLYKLAELEDNVNNYFAFNIRKYDELVRLDIVETLLYTIFNNHGPIGLLVIDGIADFAYNANEQEPTKKLVTQMCTWADNYNPAIFTAIHTNKDGKNSTGALGGFLDKKCSYHIRTEQEGGYNSATIVSAGMARSGESFKPFRFTHGLDGMPILDTGLGAFEDDSTSEIHASPKAKVKDLLKEMPF